MENLDYYLSTPDEHFNLSAQYWYFELTGNKKPNTEKPVEVFLKAFHEVYFFIQDNLNKPFVCIEKINSISETSGFNEAEKVILIDGMTNILHYHPEFEKQRIVFVQLLDFRNDLRPYMDDPELKVNWRFDLNAIKEQYKDIKTNIEKIRFLMNLLLDYKAQIPEIDDLECEHYEKVIIPWVDTELERCEFEQYFKTCTTPTPETEPQLGKYTNSQLVLIFYYFFKGLGIELRRDTDIAPIAKFLHLITGKKLSKIQNSDFYIKLSKAPNFNADKSLFDDLNYIKPSFEAVGLNNVVRLIDNEIDLCRRGE